MAHADIGIIGGSGLGEELARRGGQAVTVDTPYGPPSDRPVLAEWEGVRVAYLARHGPGHCFNPSNVPYRANIWALKSLGVTSIIASGAVGSLREDIEPGQLVLCDQVIDRTHRRAGSFFDDGLVAHVELAEPFCPRLREALSRASAGVGATVHRGGTYICMEGPQFSTRAESLLHRSWGGDLIGMTCMPEARLAREAEICYALVALATDYDCWRPHQDGNPDSVLQHVIANLGHATRSAIGLIAAGLRSIGTTNHRCACGDALKLAVWTDVKRLSPELKTRFRPLIGKYLADSP